MMSETDHRQPVRAQGELFARKSACLIGGVMLAGFAIVCTLAAVDRSARTRLEVIEEPTGVGDPIGYVIPTVDPAKPAAPSSAPVLIHGGAPLFAGSTKDFRDRTMIKSGMDDAKKIRLYRRVEPGKNQEKTENKLFVKAGPGTYVTLETVPVVPKHSGIKSER